MATRTLRRTPRMLGSYVRAGAAALPAARRLPFLPGGGDEMVDLQFEVHEASAQRARLAAYSRLCGFPDSEHLPPSYPHVLAFPLHMKLLSNRRFPFAPVGLVHVESRILAHHPIPRGAALELRVRASAVEAHPRGASFTLITKAFSDGVRMWEGTSTLLHRERSSVHGRDGRAEEPEEMPIQDRWELSADLGRRYGAVSGDRNPIHLHPLAARALGFPGAIAHGMWTLARCLAALAPDPREALGVEVALRKPIVLPASVELTSAVSDGGGADVEFAVRDAARRTPHLDGRLWRLGSLA